MDMDTGADMRMNMNLGMDLAVINEDPIVAEAAGLASPSHSLSPNTPCPTFGKLRFVDKAQYLASPSLDRHLRTRRKSGLTSSPSTSSIPTTTTGTTTPTATPTAASTATSTPISTASSSPRTSPSLTPHTPGEYFEQHHHRLHHHRLNDYDDPSSPLASATASVSAGLRTPSLLSSPSIASSLGHSTGRTSPLRKQISRPSSANKNVDEVHHNDLDASPTTKRSIASTTTPRPDRRSRNALARRLSQLAEQLTTGGEDLVDDDDVALLKTQLDHMEDSMSRKSGSPSVLSSPSPRFSPPPRVTPQRPISFDWHQRGNSLGNVGSIFNSPPSSIFRTRFSDLSPSVFREPVTEVIPEPDPPPNMGMTVQQAKKVIAELSKLNEELSNAVINLKARQEESVHIQDLLVERAERAAQRIMFLQSRIGHLEQELHENDDELQHVRILLKAVEIQMPPHPDKELQRCIVNFKEDYKALKRKRASRPSFPSTPTHSSYLNSPGR